MCAFVFVISKSRRLALAQPEHCSEELIERRQKNIILWFPRSAAVFVISVFPCPRRQVKD